jgi:branched-chain amino acid aminotransferase
VTPEEAETADEVFITSSLRDIQGVEQWDGRVLPTSRPVTEQLAAQFEQRSVDQLDP